MRTLILSAILGALLMSCAGEASKNAPIPRRTAYPRVQVYEAAYREVDGLPLVINANVDANSDVQRREDGSIWINISYPKYQSTVYLTLTPVTAEDLESVIDNRTERIHRNIGYVQPQIVDIRSDAGYVSSLVVTPSVITTPIQLISVRDTDPKWVVSGTAFFDHAKVDSPIDSLRPMIDVMQRDIGYMLKNIEDR